MIHLTKKIIYVILLTIILSLSIDTVNYTQVYAADTVDDVIGGANDFIGAGTTPVTNASELDATSKFIYNLLLAIAIIVAVVVGMVIGIQFMMAGVEEKAKIKEQLMPYVVGCVVVFGAFGIWRLAITILSKW